MNEDRATLAVFDLDGTITRHDTLTPMVLGYLLRHPWRLPRLAGALPVLLRYALGQADRGALKGAFLHAALGGLSRQELDDWIGAWLPRLLRRGLLAEALERIAWHRSRGHRLVLMSASVDFYVPRLGARLGFDETICSQVLYQGDGTLDGRLASTNCRGAEKRRQFGLLQQRLQPARTYAYGNSAADLEHMRLASEAWYVNGPAAAASATIRPVRWHRRGRL